MPTRDDTIYASEARPAPHDAVVAPAAATEPPHELDDSMPMTISGTPEAAAEKVDHVSVEGRPSPGDAKSGPGKIRLEIILAIGVVVLITLGIGLWFGPWAGLAALAVGAAAVMFNPVIGAAMLRVGDRSEAIKNDPS